MSPRGVVLYSRPKAQPDVCPAIRGPHFINRRQQLMIRAEYIWIDGTEPLPLMRSKTKVMDCLLYTSDAADE